MEEEDGGGGGAQVRGCLMGKGLVEGMVEGTGSWLDTFVGSFFDGELSSASFVLDAAIVHTFVHESTGIERCSSQMSSQRLV